MIEVGNPERDFFLFDIGSGALMNFTGLHLPVTGTSKVFLSHLHADHIGDMPGLLGSLAKIGRIDPVEIWGGGSDEPELGLAAFVDHMTKALAWDTRSFRGLKATSGAAAIPHELPYDRPDTVYQRNGVTISSFPVIHALNGALGYKIEYAGLKVVFSGDTRPCRYVVEAAQGADLLIHECFQSPRVAARAMGLDEAVVAKLLKANTNTLNRLMIRCEIETLYGGRGRGKVLLFGLEDVGTVALAYWLFRSGLRNPAIKGALNDKRFAEFRSSLGNTDEIEKAGSEFPYLVSWRVAKGNKARQEVRLAKDIDGVQQILSAEKQFGFVVVPIGRLLKELAGRIRKSHMRK